MAIDYSRRQNNVISNHNHQRDLSSGSSSALKVQSLSKVFESAAGRVVALKKINFTINKGEFVSIIGPSGSGKSTLLNILGALDRPTFGKVFIGDIDIFS